MASITVKSENVKKAAELILSKIEEIRKEELDKEIESVLKPASNAVSGLFRKWTRYPKTREESLVYIEENYDYFNKPWKFRCEGQKGACLRLIEMAKISDVIILNDKDLEMLNCFKTP